MITLKKSSVSGVSVDMPNVTSEQASLVTLTKSIFGFIMRRGEELTGAEMSQRILSSYDSPQAKALALNLELIDNMPAHYIYTTSDRIDESDLDYRVALNRAKGDLCEKAMIRLNAHDGKKGYPFSFRNDQGDLSIALSFGKDEFDAYTQVDFLSEFVTPNQKDKNVINRPIDGSMTLVQMLNVIQDSMFVLPAINYLPKQSATA